MPKAKEQKTRMAVPYARTGARKQAVHEGTAAAPSPCLAAAFLEEIDALSYMVDPSRAGELTDAAQQQCHLFPGRLQAHACEASVQAHALQLAALIVQRRLQLCPPGMIPAVCAVMRAHPASLSVQHEALEVITALRRHHFPSLQEADVLSPIVDVLNRHGADERAVRALVLLADAANHSMDELPGMHDSMVKAGVLQALVRTMKLGRTVKKFQQRAVQCLQRLVLRVPHEMIAAGVADAVFDCMRQFHTQHDVVHGGVFVLFHLEKAGRPGAEVDFFAPSRGMELLFSVNALTSTTKSLELIENVARNSTRAMMRMVDIGLVELVGTALAQRCAFESVLAAARVALVLSSEAQTRHQVAPSLTDPSHVCATSWRVGVSAGSGVSVPCLTAGVLVSRLRRSTGRRSRAAR